MLTPFDRATLPPDLRSQKFRWERLPSQSWTEEPLRARVLAFLGGFLASRPWACEWGVTERFGVQDRATLGLEWKQRSGVSRIERDEDFVRRRGAQPTLIMRVKRGKDSKEFEIGVPFLEMNNIDATSLVQTFDLVERFWDRSNRNE